MDKLNELLTMVVEDRTDTFEKTFNELMQEKIGSRVSVIRESIARGIFKNKLDESSGLSLKVHKNESEDLTDEVIDMIKEEILDELSKGTLANYIRGASNNVAKIRVDQQGHEIAGKEYLELGDKKFKRRLGIDKALSRLTKEQVDAFEAALDLAINESIAKIDTTSDEHLGLNTDYETGLDKDSTKAKGSDKSQAEKDEVELLDAAKKLKAKASGEKELTKESLSVNKSILGILSGVK